MKTLKQALIEMPNAANENNKGRVLELNAYIEIKNEHENKNDEKTYLSRDNARMCCFMAIKEDEKI